MIWEERRSGWTVPEGDARTPFDVDYGRVVHAGSFRRLQGKTQILNLGDSDFYRTRLTHSLEVAQIARGIARQIAFSFKSHPAITTLAPQALIETAGACHDLGHPPFGHGGEAALNYCMRDKGGFEGNGQTLRILTRLESFSKIDGSDLTRRALLAVLKYPASFDAVRNFAQTPSLAADPTAVRLLDRESCKPPKCFLGSETNIVEWILQPLSDNDRTLFQEVETRSGEHGKTKHKSFDCSIMDVADDIAYGVHDLEDALALRLIDVAEFEKYVPDTSCAQFLNALSERFRDECGNDAYGFLIKKLFGASNDRKHMISKLVGHFIMNLDIATHNEFNEPLLKYRVALKEKPRVFLKALKKLVRQAVILSPNVQQLEFKGQQMVVAVFEALHSDPRSLLPRDFYSVYESTNKDLRVICDYVAGMTDHYLLRTYERLFSPRMGSVFDKL